MSAELSPIQQNILRAIDIIRAEHHACTAGAVALTLKYSKSYVVEQLQKMKGTYVDWTPLGGSLHRIEAADATERTDEIPSTRVPVTDPAVVEASSEAAAEAAATALLDDTSGADQLGAGEGVTTNKRVSHDAPPTKGSGRAAKKAATTKAPATRDAAPKTPRAPRSGGAPRAQRSATG